MGSGADGGGDPGCEIVTKYSYQTQAFFSSYPQPTIYTSTVSAAPSDPTPAPAPGPVQYDSIPSPSHSHYRRRSPELYPWYDVLALEHVTTYGVCPTPTPSPTPLPQPDPGSPTASDHPGVNVHRAILAGALATCIIVLLLAVAAAVTIVLWRRSRRRASEGKEPLQDVDETSTTVSSVPSERGRDRLESYSASKPNWIITPTVQAHIPNNRLSHPTCEPIETLMAKPRDASFISGWQMDDRVLRTGPPSIAISEDSHAPSFFPGDEAKFLSVAEGARVRHVPSGSALSCAATIASESVASATPLPTLTNSSTDTGSLGPAMASLMDHKTFILTMMASSGRQAEEQNREEEDSYEDDDELDRRRSGVCESVESEMGQSTESTYWKPRTTS